MSHAHYDVIIVGGRPSGSTLAARLGQQGLRVLLLERAVFPSVPAASSPIIYASTMHLLDEIGADEAHYAEATPRLTQWNYQVRDDVQVVHRIPTHLGRDYAYAIDRARFDAHLWQTAQSYPSVTAYQPFTVTQLMKEGQVVTGVRGHGPEGVEETFTADCVVGADGRFSSVAQSVAAAAYAVHEEWPTSYYYAYWKRVTPYSDAGPTIHLYGPGRGYGFLLMDSADDTTCVVIGGQTARFADPDRTPAEMYRHLLKTHPHVWQRLAHAEQITKVYGMKNVGNLYRTASGPGWVLVGDALHQKDPVDGQGIYDAVMTAKLLSAAFGSWKRGTKSWEQAMEQYRATVHAETAPMYDVTLERVQRELHQHHADWSYRTWIRWLTTDPEYQRRLGLLLVRGISPTHWLPRSVVVKAVLQGVRRDVRQWIMRRANSHQTPTA